MSVRVDQLPAEHVWGRLQHHVHHLRAIEDESLDMDPEYYMLLLEDMDGLNQLHLRFVEQLESCPNLRHHATLLQQMRSEALEFYELVYDQVDRIRDYLEYLLNLRDQIEREVTTNLFERLNF
jgi:hypothetical protein